MFSVTIDWSFYLHPCCCKPHRKYRYQTLKPFHVLKLRVPTGTHQSSGNERVAPFDFTNGYMKLPSLSVCLSVCVTQDRFYVCISRDMGTYAALHAVHLANVLYSYRSTLYIMGHAVAQLVKALRYKPEGRRFDSRWCHCKFGTQHGCHHDTNVKPEAATAVIELLMMGGKTPETC
jgi:hypothetical protein